MVYTEPSHPERGDELTELERFLFRFRMVANESLVILRGFHKTGDAAASLNNDLFFALTNQCLIVVCKFLEIWREFGRLRPSQPKVVDIQEALSPYIRRIELWKGLDQFRNSALAHPYLTKDRKIIGPWELIAENRAPTYHAECILLLQVAKLSVLAILWSFPEDYRAIRPLLRSSKPNPGPAPGIELGTEIDPVLKKLTAAVQVHLNRIGVLPNAAITSEFVAAEKRTNEE